jgi:hypothetical protein
MDQRAFVASFLLETFGGVEKVPPVEFTKENVALLFDLAQRNVLMNQIGVEERNDNRIRAEEYAAEALRIQSLLEATVAPESLSGPGKATLASIARAAVVLRDPEGNHLFEAVMSLLERKVQEVFFCGCVFILFSFRRNLKVK